MQRQRLASTGAGRRKDKSAWERCKERCERIKADPARIDGRCSPAAEAAMKHSRCVGWVGVTAEVEHSRCGGAEAAQVLSRKAAEFCQISREW